MNQEARNMSTMADRMALAEAILALIEKKRLETRDETLGAAIERVILDTQFHDIEGDILDNPGAFEPWLLPRRRDD
jgi:hypothetical protein